METRVIQERETRHWPINAGLGAICSSLPPPQTTAGQWAKRKKRSDGALQPLASASELYWAKRFGLTSQGTAVTAQKKALPPKPQSPSPKAPAPEPIPRWVKLDAVFAPFCTGNTHAPGPTASQPFFYKCSLLFCRPNLFPTLSLLMITSLP